MINQNWNRTAKRILLTIIAISAMAAGCGGGKSAVAPSLQDNMRASDRRVETSSHENSDDGGGDAGYNAKSDDDDHDGEHEDGDHESGRTVLTWENVNALMVRAQALYDHIQSMDAGNFKNGQKGKNVLLHAAEEVISKLNNNHPNGNAVVNDINNTILNKANGCGVSGAPDGNDLLINCADQATLNAMGETLAKTVVCGGIAAVNISTAGIEPVSIRPDETVSFKAVGSYVESACGEVDVTSEAVWSSTVPSVADFGGAAGTLTGLTSGDVFVSATAFGISSTNQIPVAVIGCEQVVFADPGLEAVVRGDVAYTGAPTGRICVEDVAAIKLLTLDGVLTTGNLAGIEKLTALRTLYLQRNNLTDISQLAALTELRKVILNYNNVTDLSPLSGAYWLINLSVVGNGITDISPLAGISNLLTVNLSNNYISNISALGYHSRMISLTLENNLISDVSPLASLQKMEELRLDNNQIYDISALAGKGTLKILSLSNNHITDLQPVAGLTALNTLAVSKNGLVNIAPVAGLTALTAFIAEDNKISDISALSGLSLLKNIVLNGNVIRNVSPLQNMLAVTYIGLNKNQVSDVSPLAQNAGVGAGDQVVLTLNPLSADSLNAQIPALLARGVSVTY